MRANKDEDGFDDWVNNLYGFIHLINPTTPAPRTATLLHVLATSIAAQQADEAQDVDDDPDLDYNIIPRSTTAAQIDKCVEQVHDWLTFFDQPSDMPNREYKALKHYATGFFRDDDRLWKCNTHSAHKWVLYCDCHIKHIRISRYNLHTNRIVKCSHFNVQQALYKAVDGEQGRWAHVAHSVFWSERVMPQRHMGCSPYFAATGTHPILPFDIVEANYLLPSPNSILLTTDLVASCAIALQKCTEDLALLRDQVHAECNCAAIHFEREHAATLCDFNFQHGDLVLICNMAIEKALNRKVRPRYTGPLVVISRNHGGTYILTELDGMLMHAPFAAFCVLPYFVCEHINIPDLKQHLDITAAQLCEMEATNTMDPNFRDTPNDAKEQRDETDTLDD